jgi:hypothetical protein
LVGGLDVLLRGFWMFLMEVLCYDDDDAAEGEEE